MKKICLFILIFVFTLNSSLFADDSMTLAYFDDFAPYSWKENNKMFGILIDIADESLHRQMGIDVKHQGFPWARAQRLVKNGTAHALITNGPLRKEWTQYSEAVLELKTTLFIKKGNPKLHQLEKIKVLEDLRPFTMVDYRGNGWCKENLIDNNFKVFITDNQKMIFPMLIKERADVYINDSLVSRYVIKKLGLQSQIVEIPVKIDSVPFHLCIEKNSAFTKILPKFNKTILQMKKNGDLQKIIEKYRYRSDSTIISSQRYLDIPQNKGGNSRIVTR
ncbi:ABC transporter substrate-binding protein [Desulfonema ishimotonii]|uniref:ABC transporter substrate-binding protein n=1 Tax=Desulfonema ishimotonii TaxID=45657 RepID=A0A401G2P3_9BACT|nr:transporter substrate-binding domain-containing protein [Desulfonema ishimotonii]GBC63519.1 ABC transporter substrate-binding protein [Desulfonema ishimotonii]